MSLRQAFGWIGGQVGVYGIGNALQRSGAFLLLPLYLWRLSPQEYGLLGLVSAIPFVLTTVLTLGFPNAITRYYHEWRDKGVEAPHLGMVWMFATGPALVAAALLDRFGAFLLAKVLTQVPYEPYGRLGLWWAFFSSLSLCPMALLRIREQARAYVLVSQASFFFGVGLIAWAILSGWGVEGVLWMQLISSALIGAVLSGWYLTQASLRFPQAEIGRVMRLVFPLVPSALLEAIASRVDRYFLDKWVGLQDIGMYTLANQLGQGVKFFYDSIKPAWIPFYIRIAGERLDAPEFLGKSVTYYIAILGMAAVAVLFAGPFVVALLSPDNLYDSAVPLLPIMTGGYVLQGLVLIGSLAVLVSERTAWMPFVQTIHFLVVVMASWLLVPRFGVTGAAWALVLAYGLQMSLYVIIGQRCYPVQLQWGRIAVLMAGGGIVGGLWMAFPFAGMFIKLAWVFGYGVLLLAVVYGRTFEFSPKTHANE